MKLKVGYRNLTVGVLPDDVAKSAGHYGQYRPHEGKILVARCQPVDEMADTLIHEVLHAVVDERDLPEVLGDREETVVRALAHGLTALAKDNPEFFKVWMSLVAGRKPPAFLS